LRHGNSNFGSASEPHILIYATSGLAVDFTSTRARSHFRKADFKNRANRTMIMPGFLQRLFQMIIEIAAALFLILFASMISRLIERRRDVFHYVSKPDPRW
jgi:hypothetical protein